MLQEGRFLLMSYQEYFGETHHLVRQTVRKFVEREINPYVNEWEEQGEFPRELYRRAGEAGILGIGYPEVFGGTEGDLFLKVAAIEEIARCGSSSTARQVSFISKFSQSRNVASFR